MRPAIRERVGVLLIILAVASIAGLAFVGVSLLWRGTAVYVDAGVEESGGQMH